MFELIHGNGRRPSRRERLAAWLTLDRAIGLTRAQRFARAVLWLALGGLLAAVSIGVRDATTPAVPVVPLEPRVQHRAADYTVYTIGLEWRGEIAACEFIVFHDRQTWRLSCPRR